MALPARRSRPSFPQIRPNSQQTRAAFRITPTLTCRLSCFTGSAQFRNSFFQADIRTTSSSLIKCLKLEAERGKRPIQWISIKSILYFLYFLNSDRISSKNRSRLRTVKMVPGIDLFVLGSTYGGITRSVVCRSIINCPLYPLIVHLDSEQATVPELVEPHNTPGSIEHTLRHIEIDSDCTHLHCDWVTICGHHVLPISLMSLRVSLVCW